MWQKWIKPNLLEIIWGMFFLVLAVMLNFQLTEASNINKAIGGQDEYLTVRQVFSILDAPDLKHRIMAIIAGEKLYYGRVMFYMDAFIAAIPYAIWGVKGMVLSIRMTHALVLAMSLLLLAWPFISERRIRFAFLIFSTLLAYTFYFIMMPKPEVWQLLFLALFLRTWIRSEYKSSKPFIWLGLAYGVKFNVLFFLPFVGLIFIIKNAFKIKQHIYVMGYFILGFLIAIPCLILSPIKPIFLKTYIAHTFKNTAQADDDPAVNAITWLQSGYGKQYLYHEWLAVLVFILIAGILLKGIKEMRKSREISPEFLFVLLGATLFFPVVLFTKRIWPHYIWEGHIFFTMGFAVYYWKEEGLNKWRKIGKWVSLLLCAVGALGFLKLSYRGFFDLDAAYTKDKNQWEEADKYILSRNPKAIVGLGAGVWYPFKEYIKIQPYHPFEGRREEEKPLVKWISYLSDYNAMEAGDYLVIPQKYFDQTQNEKNRKVRGDDFWGVTFEAEIEKKNILKDTIIGTYHLYKIVKK